MPEDLDAARRIRDLSSRLLDEIADLRLLEAESRTTEVGSSEFIRASREIEAKARDIFRLTSEQRLLGEQVAEQGVAIEDFDPDDEG